MAPGAAAPRLGSFSRFPKTQQNSRSLCQNLHPKSSFRISMPCPTQLWTPHWVLPFVPMGFHPGVFRCFATRRFRVAPGQNQGEFHLHRWEEVRENPAQPKVPRWITPKSSSRSRGEKEVENPTAAPNQGGKLLVKRKEPRSGSIGICSQLEWLKVFLDAGWNSPIPCCVCSLLSHQEHSRSFSIFSKNQFFWLVLEFKFPPN